MKSIFRGSLFVLALVTIVALAPVFRALAALATRARDWVVKSLPAMPRAGVPIAPDLPLVQLVRAVAYRVRKMKRDVMEMRPGYRHCPSI